MKGNCNYQPQPVIEYGKTGTGQVLFNIERNDKEGEESWDYDYVEVANFKRETIVAAIVRSKYTQDQSEAILMNVLADEDTGEFAEYQSFRKLAENVADGEHLKEELTLATKDYNPGNRFEKIEVSTEEIKDSLKKLEIPESPVVKK